MSDASNAGDVGMGPKGSTEEDMDRYLTNKASAFRYPPTPDIAAAVRNRLAGESMQKARGGGTQYRPRRVRAAMAVMMVVVLGALLAVPQVRSFVGDVYTGVVQIFKNERGPLPVPNVPVATPTPEWSSMLYGETDLGNALQLMKCPIKLPTYPAGLGMPDHVFYQSPSGIDTTILVWMERDHPDKPRLALYVMTKSDLVMPILNDNPNQVKTRVYQDEAHWVTGTISLDIFNPAGKKALAPTSIVDGPVLIWAESISNAGGCASVVYRLETNMPLDEAVKVAESLRAPDVLPTPVPTNTPAPTTTPVSPASALNLAGETRLLGLSQSAGFAVKIPVVPDQPDLVSPGRIFLQDLGSPAVIMAWYVKNRTDDISVVLYQIKGTDKLAGQTASSTLVLQQAAVHGNPAQWIQGPHVVYTTDGQNGQVLQAKNFISGGHTLVWEEGGVTYRLETGGTVTDAVKIAEALK